MAGVAGVAGRLGTPYVSPVNGRTIDLGRALALVSLNVDEIAVVLRDLEKMRVFFVDPAGNSQRDARNAGYSAAEIEWFEMKYAGVARNQQRMAQALGQALDMAGLEGLYLPPNQMETQRGILYRRPFFGEPLILIRKDLEDTEVLHHEVLHHLFSDVTRFPGDELKTSQISRLRQLRLDSQGKLDQLATRYARGTFDMSSPGERSDFAAAVRERIRLIQANFLMDVSFQEDELEVYGCHAENWIDFKLSPNRLENSIGMYVQYLTQLAGSINGSDSFGNLSDLQLSWDQLEAIDPEITRAIEELESHRARAGELFARANKFKDTLISLLKKARGLGDEAVIEELRLGLR